MPPERLAGQIGTVERILFLKRMPALAGLAPAEIAVVADNARERHLRRGDVLLREGQAIGSLFCIVDGRVHVTRRGQPLGHAGPGAAVGGYAMFARDSHGIGALAETDTIALELESEVVFEMLEEHFAILRHLLRDVSRQLIGILRASPLPLTEALPDPASAPAAEGELDLVERLFFLRQARAFQHTSIGALAQLSRGLTQTQFPDGSDLWSPGDSASWLLLVVSGEVVCRVPEHAEPFVVGPGFPLGALDSVGSVPRWYQARTRGRVVGLQGHVEELIDVFEDNFEMAQTYLATQCAWLLAGIERLGREALPVHEKLYGCDPPEACEAGTGADVVTTPPTAAD